MILTWTTRKLQQFEVTVTFEPADNEHDDRLAFRVIMPNNMWFCLGFGETMSNTDMIAWHSASEESFSQDYWSVSREAPVVDGSVDLETKFTRLMAKQEDVADDYDRMVFLSYRNLDTGDSAQDYLINLRERTDMIYAWRERNSIWKYHSKRGNF